MDPEPDAPPPALAPQHLADLRRSGLTDDTIAAAGLYSVTDPHAVRDLLGGYMSVKTAAKLGACLAIPFPDRGGTPTGYVRLRPDHPRKDRNGKPVKYESPLKGGNRLYVPPGVGLVLADPAGPVAVTEGEKKALAGSQAGVPTVALSGVWNWTVKRPRDEGGRATGPRELIPDLAGVSWAGRRVVVVFDSDLADKPAVAWARWHLCQALAGRGADVRVVDLPADPGGAKCGLDDFLVANGADAFRGLVEAAQPPPRPPAGGPPGGATPAGRRPEIVIGTDEHRVNDEAVAALAREPGVFHRGGLLVRVTEQDDDPDPAAAVRRPAGAPAVRELARPVLREALTRVADWRQWRGSGERAELVPAHPPEWCVGAVHARGRWPGVRPLDAVLTHPVLMPDGGILTADGYHPGVRVLTRLPPGLAVAVPDRPTGGEVAAAVGVLLDPLADFPFETPAHRAALVAGLLTPLAWFLFDGPAPLFLIDGNVRGVGKGLLADVVALTVTGRRFAVMSYTNDREELRKKVTTLAMEGERLVLLDNLAGAVGNDVLDAALTTDRWKDRVLGGNRVYDGPLHVTWYATGNNVQLHADTSRRVCHARMESADERPEMKSGFRHPDLRAHVRANRGPLLSAALTILRAWVVAGRPTHSLPPWGSFEGWSSVVREAVVFAGLPDPGDTRVALQTTADRDAAAMSDVLDGLARMDEAGRGLTAAEIVTRIKDEKAPSGWVADLRAAVEDLCGKLDGRALGYRFRHFARRNFGGRVLDKSDAPHGSNRWVVRAAGGRAGPCPPCPPCPPSSNPGGGHGGHGGDVSPAAPTGPEPGRGGDGGHGGDDSPGPPPVPPPAPPQRRFRSDDRPHDRREDG